MSLEMTSRAERAFSLAELTASTIEQPPGTSRANATRSVSAHISSRAFGGSIPSTSSRMRDARSGSTLESSSSWWTVTSRMRAVSSARST